MRPSRLPSPVAAHGWPPRLRTAVCAVGLLGLLGTISPLVGGPGAPAWLAPRLADAAAAPLRADLPDSTFARLHAGYVAEIGFAADAFARVLRAAHGHLDRWLAVPVFLVLSVCPWWSALRRRGPAAAPATGLPGGVLARAALLALVPLQLVFHATSIQPLLGAWIGLLDNLTRTLLMLQVQAYTLFAPGASRATALFFAQESPHMEAQMQRQLWLLRGADLALAGLEAFVLLWMARSVSRAHDAARSAGAVAGGPSRDGA